jgi:hypothetical protein
MTPELLILIGAVLFLTSIVCFFLAGFMAWRKSDGSKKHFWCFHDIVTGGGGMGDGVDCNKCGLSTYDAFNSHLWIFKLLGRVDRK